MPETQTMEVLQQKLENLAMEQEDLEMDLDIKQALADNVSGSEVQQKVQQKLVAVQRQIANNNSRVPPKQLLLYLVRSVIRAAKQQSFLLLTAVAQSRVHMT